VEDKESFRSADAKRQIGHLTPQEFDARYPQGITSDQVGYPYFYMKYAGKFYFDRYASATENGNNVNFRYWKQPTYYSTATAAGTSDIPEPFDKTCLVALATLKLLTYLGNSEASIYKVQVYGNGKDIEGSLDKMKDLYSSPNLKPRMTYQL